MLPEGLLLLILAPTIFVVTFYSLQRQDFSIILVLYSADYIDFTLINNSSIHLVFNSDKAALERVCVCVVYTSGRVSPECVRPHQTCNEVYADLWVSEL